jgi:hypothetical protein
VSHGAHETTDVSTRPIVIAGAAILALVLLSSAGVWVLIGHYARREAAASAPNPLASYGPKAPPSPRLQTEPRHDLEKMRAAEDETLHGYGWVDRSAGRVRIPIERAMELIAKTGGKP